MDDFTSTRRRIKIRAVRVLAVYSTEDLDFRLLEIVCERHNQSDRDTLLVLFNGVYVCYVVSLRSKRSLDEEEKEALLVFLQEAGSY